MNHDKGDASKWLGAFKDQPAERETPNVLGAYTVSDERLAELIAEHKRSAMLYCAMNDVKVPRPEQREALMALRELQSLRAEAGHLRSCMDEQLALPRRADIDTIAELRARIASLEARNASLEKDAARYRWLRTAGAWESEIGMDELSKDPAKYDAAIDAAIKERV